MLNLQKKHASQKKVFYGNHFRLCNSLFSSKDQVEFRICLYVLFHCKKNFIVNKSLRIRNKTTVIIRNSSNKTENGLKTQDDIMEIK